MLPEAVVLRLYGSLVRFIRPSRLFVFALLVFGISKEFLDFLFNDLYKSSVINVYDFVKTEFLESSFFVVLISFGLSFVAIPMVNKFVLENFAKKEHQYTDALVETVRVAVKKKSRNLNLHEWKQKSKDGSKKIKNIFFTQELLLGFCFYFLYYFIFRGAAFSLLFFLFFMLCYVISSWYFVRKIMVIYITKIYFFNEVVKEKSRLGDDDMTTEI